MRRTERSIGDRRVRPMGGLFAGVLGVISASGCVALPRHPVAEHVVESRQLSLRGIDAAQQGNWTEAEKLFATAIEIHPADELNHQRYAEALWRRGQQTDAIRHMETATRLSGGEPPLVIKLGQMYLSADRVAEAQREAERAVHARPAMPEAWALQGDVLSRLSRPSDAMTSYHRALSLQPHQPQVQMALCRLYLAQQRPRRALATINSLADTFPPDSVPPTVLALKGTSLRQLDRFNAAIEVLSQAVQTSEPTPDLLYELAQTHLLAGDPASAHLVALGIRGPAVERPRFRQLFDQIRLAANAQIRGARLE